jgi:hypothetical protein
MLQIDIERIQACADRSGEQELVEFAHGTLPGLIDRMKQLDDAVVAMLEYVRHEEGCSAHFGANLWC